MTISKSLEFDGTTKILNVVHRVHLLNPEYRAYMAFSDSLVEETLWKIVELTFLR